VGCKRILESKNAVKFIKILCSVFEIAFITSIVFIIQFSLTVFFAKKQLRMTVRLLVILYHSSSSIFLASPLGTFIKNSFFVLTIFIASLILIVKLFSLSRFSLVGFFYLFLKLLKQCCTINRDYFSCVLFRFAFFLLS
jgi:hypothetical protein